MPKGDERSESSDEVIEGLKESKLKEIVRNEVKKEVQQKEEKIEQLENEVEKLKSQKSRSKVEGKNNSNISRRQFLKKAGIGAAGLASLGLAPTQALNLKSSSLTFSDSTNQYLNISNGGPVEIHNTDLQLNDNDITGFNHLSGTKIVAESDLVVPTTSPGSVSSNRVWLDTENKDLKITVQNDTYTLSYGAIVPQSDLFLKLDDSNDDGRAEITDSEGNYSPSGTEMVFDTTSPENNLSTGYGGSADLGYSANGSNIRYIEFSSSSAFDFGTGDFTISFWFYYYGDPESTGNNYLFDTDGFGNRMSISPTSNKGGDINDFGISTTLVPSSSYSYGSSATWHLFTRKRSSGTEHIYIDGTEVKKFSNGTDYSLTGGRINHYGSGSNTDYMAEANVSNFRVWKKALTNEQITELYNNTKP